MAFPRLEYSNKDVKRSGKIIAGKLLWSDETAPSIREAFHIANNWRDSHAYPMRSIRAQLNWFMRRHQLSGVTAARLKRMQAIRRKLRRPDLPQSLNQLQDLGGCRVILRSIADVRTLVEALRGSRHELWGQEPYIQEPKADGYRSHHLRYKFRGKGSFTIYDGRRIEVQIRTRLQHAWATAVEAVGLFRGEDLKGNHGSPEWLRLFKLMSAEFARAENCPEPPDVPSHNGCVSEIRELDGLLKAADTLDTLSNVMRWTDIAVDPATIPSYYLIKFDNLTKQVIVEPHFKPLWAVASYEQAEASDNESGENTTNVVLVEADKVENLKDAYPNYFGDVQLFKTQLKTVIEGQPAQEYTVRPQETVAPKPKEKPSLGWFRPGRERQWE